jgi:3-deoxy-D-manno-octulosonic acid kinase
MAALQPPEPVLPVAVAVGRADVTAHADIRDDLLAIVRAHGSVYDWAAEQPQPRALRGRAPVYVATLPSSQVPVVVRHAWHGGLLAPLTGDRFRRPTRAPREMQRSAALRAAGIPTTEVLGFVRYDAGAGLARVDVVTRYVDDTADLGMVLAGLTPDVDCEPALLATIDLLRALAQHGIVHPDLNVKNVLLRRRATGSPDALVIDIDVIDWDPRRPPAEAMTRNIARLLRSMRKWRRQFGCELSEQRLAALQQAALGAVAVR